MCPPKNAAGLKACQHSLRVLVVDDDRWIARSVARAISILKPGWRTECTGSAEAALRELEREPCDLVVTDLNMPGLAGLAWLRRLRSAHPQVVCVAYSSHIESIGEDEVRRLVHGLVEKPAPPSELVREAERCWSELHFCSACKSLAMV